MRIAVVSDIHANLVALDAVLEDLATQQSDQSHVPMLPCHRESRIVNPGSMGLPIIRRGGRVWHPPWADYALIGWSEDELSVEFRRVAVDVGAVVRAAFESGMPHAEWRASAWSEPWREGR